MGWCFGSATESLGAAAALSDSTERPGALVSRLHLPCELLAVGMRMLEAFRRRTFRWLLAAGALFAQRCLVNLVAPENKASETLQILDRGQDRICVWLLLHLRIVTALLLSSAFDFYPGIHLSMYCSAPTHPTSTIVVPQVNYTGKNLHGKCH